MKTTTGIDPRADCVGMVRMAMFSFDDPRPFGLLRAARAMTTTPQDEASDVSHLAAPCECVVELVPEVVVALAGYSLPTRPERAPRRKR